MSKSGTTEIQKCNESNDSLDFEATITWTKEITKENIPDHIVFPKELNIFLRNQIQDLTAENGCLRRSLEEAEEKLNKRQHTAETPQVATILGKPSEMTAAKIIELSKRCREQTAEIEVLKSKCKNLETTLANKEIELGNERLKGDQLQFDSFKQSAVANQTKEDEDRMKCLTEKLQRTQSKVYESRNTCASLKQEIIKLQKLLCREVGENMNINTLSNQSSGWRGRAEQIHLLQQKVIELQSRLSNDEGIQKTLIGSAERKNLENIRNTEKERRQQIESSAKQFRQAEVAIEGYKRKLEASKARIKVLEHELNVVKGNVSILNEKKSHDDHFIETLGNRLKTSELKHQEREIDIKNKEEKFERECANLKNDLQSAQLQIDRLRRKLEEREIEIDKLRNGTVPNIGVIKPQKIRHPEVYDLDLSTSPQSSGRLCDPNEYVTLALAAEVERERLLELVTVLNRRLDKERSDADILANSLNNERSKTMKLELKFRKLEMERVGMTRVDTGYKSKFFTKSLKANEELMNAEQTRFKMELLQEECLALKARLHTVQQDKASDLVMYKQMLVQIRRIFQNACKSEPLPTIGSRSIVTV